VNALTFAPDEAEIERRVEALLFAAAGPLSAADITLLSGKTSKGTLVGVTAEFVIASYARLLNIEKSFRMSKHDLQARPIYHHKRELIEAHLNVVFAALAIIVMSFVLKDVNDQLGLADLVRVRTTKKPISSTAARMPGIRRTRFMVVWVVWV